MKLNVQVISTTDRICSSVRPCSLISTTSDSSIATGSRVSLAAKSSMALVTGSRSGQALSLSKDGQPVDSGLRRNDELSALPTPFSPLKGRVGARPVLDTKVEAKRWYSVSTD